MSTENDPTIHTYNRIAQRYLERRKDRSAISHHLARFVGLIKEQGLEDLPVIDIGCGPGFDVETMREEGLHSIGLDLSWGMLITGKRNYPNNYLMANMITLPTMEVIGGLWSCASLLHLPRANMPATLKEFARVLVPGGVLCLSVKEGVGHKWSATTDGEPGSRLFTLWESSALDWLVEASDLKIVHSTTETSAEGTMWLTRFAIKS